MTPAARIAATIEILEGLAASPMPADRFIRDFFRTRRYAGSKDRAAVAGRVFQVFRHRAAFAWRMGDDSPRALAIASVLAEEGDVEALFSGQGHAPPPLSEAERAAIAPPPPGDAPLHVKGEFPAFLEPELRARFGANLLVEMQALVARAPIDLRVNTLKAARDDVLAALRALGYGAEAMAHAPHGIRIPAGASGLERTPLFEAGQYEFQDEAAQIAAELCGVAPGMRVLDLAAGAGGKSLALAAAMQNSGSIVASDIAANRLQQIGPRVARAGATIIHTHETPRGVFDRVLVDAPCSGSGTWRRQPEQKWRLTPARLDELTAIQDGLLDRAAALVAPGGQLIYATCSLLPLENERRIAAFLRREPAFGIVPVQDRWRDIGAGTAPPAADAFFYASPYAAGMDGFFTAVLVRSERPPS